MPTSSATSAPSRRTIRSRSCRPGCAPSARRASAKTSADSSRSSRVLADELLPVLPPRRGQRSPHQPELGGAVVRHDEQPVPVRSGSMRDGGTPRPCAAARPGRARSPASAAGTSQHLGRVSAPEAITTYAPDREASTISSNCSSSSCRTRWSSAAGGPQHVPPHLVRPEGVVVHGVEEGRRVRRPGAAVVGVRDLVGEVGAGAEDRGSAGVDLVARQVDRVGQQPPVGARLDQTGRAVIRARRLDRSRPARRSAPIRRSNRTAAVTTVCTPSPRRSAWSRHSPHAAN